MSCNLLQNFDEEKNMIQKETEYGIFHETRKSAALAKNLLVAREKMDLVPKILKAVLNCQEIETGSPHRGNFYWMAEDEVITDLNAVEFVLKELNLILKKYSNLLSKNMKEEVKR